MFFWPKLQQFLAKLNFNFSLHNFSRYVIYIIVFIFFARKVLGDMARTRLALHTYRRTDGRTYTEGRTIYVSRRGRHIITSWMLLDLAQVLAPPITSLFNASMRDGYVPPSLYVSPCGRHILFFPPCMSVRPYVTLPLSEPYLQEPFMEKYGKKFHK